MTLYRPELVSGDRIPMVITHPKHLVPADGKFTVGGAAVAGRGGAISKLGSMIGSDAATGAGSFDDAMLRALDGVSNSQIFADTLAQQAITDPDSIDVEDITIAQAKAEMSLNIARTVLNRVVQGWRDLINTR